MGGKKEMLSVSESLHSLWARVGLAHFNSMFKSRAHTRMKNLKDAAVKATSQKA